jgi:hypothetical protein
MGAYLKKKLLVSFTEKQVRSLKREAREKDLSVSELVRRILDEHFERGCKRSLHSSNIISDDVGGHGSQRMLPPHNEKRIKEACQKVD